MATKVGYCGLHDRELRVIMRITRTRQYSQILINTRYFPLYLLDVAPCCPHWCAELLFSPSCSRQLAHTSTTFLVVAMAIATSGTDDTEAHGPLRGCVAAPKFFLRTMDSYIHVYGVP
jgi:hypothetical protein